MTATSLNFDNKYRHQYPIIAGCDEVGRGCLAGPVVTATVILPANVDIPMIQDSKKIPKKEYHDLAHLIFNKAIEVQLSFRNADVIDKINILEADKAAMRDMVNKLVHQPDIVLIDGGKMQLLGTKYHEETVVKGDAKSLTIGAASIMAKYMRDLLMIQYDKQYPGYGFAHNDGYLTKQHRSSLYDLGVTPIHRKSFAPIKNHLSEFKINNGIDYKK